MPDSISVTATPVITTGLAPDFQGPSVRSVIHDVVALIRTAKLDGEHDRDLLEAIRETRNALFDNPTSVKLWEAGVAVFDRSHALWRQAGQPQREDDDVSQYPDIKQHMDAAAALVARGDPTSLREALTEYYQAMNTGTEFEPLWRAGYAVARKLDAIEHPRTPHGVEVGAAAKKLLAHSSGDVRQTNPAGASQLALRGD